MALCAVQSIVPVPTWLSIYWVTSANWMGNEVSWKLFPLFIKIVLASISGSSRNIYRDMEWAESFFGSSPTRVRDKMMLPISFKDWSILSTWIRAWNKIIHITEVAVIISYRLLQLPEYLVTWGAYPIAIIYHQTNNKDLSATFYISRIKDIQIAPAYVRSIQKGGKRLQAEMERNLKTIFTVVNTSWTVLKES